MATDTRHRLATFCADHEAKIVDVARRLIAVPSPNPPLDTNAVGQAALGIIQELVPSAEVGLYPGNEEVANVVARLRGRGPGKRVVLNGHLDTYPVGDASAWTVAPLGGEVKDGKLYGRGAADMKGGIAASIVAFAALAEVRDQWDGEVSLTLAGDEESMGSLGTRYLIDNIEGAAGDAAIIADAGSPMVIRFGEKGFVWARIRAAGRPAHGAHVHLGDNALDRLRRVLDRLDSLRSVPVPHPEGVAEAIAAAKAISEPLAGTGEADVLQSVTVNLGNMSGGTSPNLVPASAEASMDIRVPAGLKAAWIVEAIQKACEEEPGVTAEIIREVDPTITPPDSPIVGIVRTVARDVLGQDPTVNMRVGASDSRLFRQSGIPTVVYGPTPRNMGGADEHVSIAELVQVAKVHAIAAYDFLTG